MSNVRALCSENSASTAAGSFYLLNNALITVKEQQIIQIKFWKNNTNT